MDLSSHPLLLRGMTSHHESGKAKPNICRSLPDTSMAIVGNSCQLESSFMSTLRAIADKRFKFFVISSFKQMHTVSLANVILVCFDKNDRESLSISKEWAEKAKKQTKSLVPLILVGLSRGDNGDRAVVAEAKGLFSLFGATQYMECNLDVRIEVVDVFMSACVEALSCVEPGDMVHPKFGVNVKSSAHSCITGKRHAHTQPRPPRTGKNIMFSNPSVVATSPTPPPMSSTGPTSHSPTNRPNLFQTMSRKEKKAFKSKVNSKILSSMDSTNVPLGSDMSSFPSTLFPRESHDEVRRVSHPMEKDKSSSNSLQIGVCVFNHSPTGATTNTTNMTEDSTNNKVEVVTPRNSLSNKHMESKSMTHSISENNLFALELFVGPRHEPKMPSNRCNSFCDQGGLKLVTEAERSGKSHTRTGSVTTSSRGRDSSHKSSISSRNSVGIRHCLSHMSMRDQTDEYDTSSDRHSVEGGSIVSGGSSPQDDGGTAMTASPEMLTQKKGKLSRLFRRVSYYEDLVKRKVKSPVSSPTVMVRRSTTTMHRLKEIKELRQNYEAVGTPRRTKSLGHNKK
eukprot:CFRG3543T1